MTTVGLGRLEKLVRSGGHQEVRSDLRLQHELVSVSERMLYRCRSCAVPQMLDPSEGHVPLLRGGRFLQDWFRGTTTEELGPRNVAAFLSYCLLHQPALSE